MNEKDKIRLGHIIEAIDDLASFTEGIVDVNGFRKNKMVRSASVRELEIIGEACGALSEQFVADHPEGDWQAWKDMRTILIYQYFGVDYDRVYAVIRDEIPLLRKRILDLL